MATQSILAIDASLKNARIAVSGQVGVTRCSKIAGTNSWSQHAFDNATDYYGSPREMERAFQFLRVHPLAVTVCYNGRGGCTTDHRDHVHVDAAPTRRGTPPCAGGPPVSGGTAPVRQPTPTADTGGGFFGGIEAVGQTFSLITDPQTWIRVGLFIGGGILTAGGIWWIAKEFGVQSQIASTVGKVAKLVPLPVKAG